MEKFVLHRTDAANARHTAPVVAAVQGIDVPDLERGISFGEFVRHVTSQDPESLDPHWRPQTHYLRGVHYDPSTAWIS